VVDLMKMEFPWNRGDARTSSIWRSSLAVAVYKRQSSSLKVLQRKSYKYMCPMWPSAEILGATKANGLNLKPGRFHSTPAFSCVLSLAEKITNHLLTSAGNGQISQSSHTHEALEARSAGSLHTTSHAFVRWRQIKWNYYWSYSFAVFSLFS
jgi:hypothetical protein